MENEVQTKERSLAFWVVLLAALLAGVVGLFALLEMVAPDSWDAQIWDEMTVEKGRSGDYQMRLLTEQERGEKPVKSWLEAVAASRATESNLENLNEKVYWLYIQEEDYYVLYLPQQDRALGLADLTVSEESEVSGGENTLVIRARTGEDSESVVPGEQLFAIKTISDTWRGIRVSVILDGREKNLYKLVYANGQLLSAEEVYIGRF